MVIFLKLFEISKADWDNWLLFPVKYSRKRSLILIQFPVNAGTFYSQKSFESNRRGCVSERGKGAVTLLFFQCGRDCTQSDWQVSPTGWDIPSILSSLMPVLVTKREVSLWLLFTCFVFKSEIALLFSIHGCLNWRGALSSCNLETSPLCDKVLW